MAREWVGIQVACQKVEQLIFSIKSILNLIPFECVYRCYPPDWLHLLIIVCRRFHVRYLDPDLSTLLSEESPATNKKFQRLNDSIASLVSNRFSTRQHALKLLDAGYVIANRIEILSVEWILEELFTLLHLSHWYIVLTWTYLKSSHHNHWKDNYCDILKAFIS